MKTSHARASSRRAPRGRFRSADNDGDAGDRSRASAAVVGRAASSYSGAIASTARASSPRPYRAAVDQNASDARPRGPLRNGRGASAASVAAAPRQYIFIIIIIITAYGGGGGLLVYYLQPRRNTAIVYGPLTPSSYGTIFSYCVFEEKKKIIIKTGGQNEK